MPSDAELKEWKEKFQTKKAELDEHPYSKGLTGAVPFDVNFQELIPGYEKVLDEKLFQPADKNILSAMGMIELRGFSSNREEAILNPKVLVEEINDAVLDYVELMADVVALTKERNSAKSTFNKDVKVSAGIVKAFISDEMKSLMRSVYDRGLISKKSTVENTTPLDFETQVNQRLKEQKDGLDSTMYAPIIQNYEKDPADLTPNDEEVTDDKNKNTPEADNYKNAELIKEPMKSIRSIPDVMRNIMSKDEQQIFKTAFNKSFVNSTLLKVDNELREQKAFTFANKELKKYIKSKNKK